MDAFTQKQFTLLRATVREYREGVLALNLLVHAIEGVTEALSVEGWRQAVFPIVVDIEQINAAMVEGKKKLTVSDEGLISRRLAELEAS